MNAEELKTRMRALPDLPASGSQWGKHRQSMRKHTRTESAEEFLLWSTIQATMFVGNAPYIENELAVLRASEDWQERWRKAIVDPGFGAPTQSSLLPQSSGNYIHQSYFLNHFEGVSDLDVSKLSSVVEIGGGYGAMRTVFTNLGFEGIYEIYDLPEFSLLQQYYLSNVLNDEQFANTRFFTKLTELSLKTDLVIGISSLSEMPLYQRKRLLDICRADYYLFFSQPEFFGINNIDYFTEFSICNEHLDWKIYRNPLAFPTQYFVIGFTL